MKRTIVAVMAAVVGSGCVHRPPLTPAEQCAEQGMILEGMSLSTSGGVGVATVNGTTAIARSSSYGETVACRRPATSTDHCEVASYSEAARRKGEFNTGWRNLLIGVGYVVYILPGLVLYLVFDSQSDDAGTEATRRGVSVAGMCRR